MFEDIIKRAHKAVDDIMDKAVDHAVEVLVNESPVWTGNYVRNHIAESKPKSYPRLKALITGPYPPKVEGSGIRKAAKLRLKYQAKIILKKHKTVSINNKSKHANFVEYIGWQKSIAKFPFAKTQLSLNLNKGRIASEAIHKAFKR